MINNFKTIEPLPPLLAYAWDIPSTAIVFEIIFDFKNIEQPVMYAAFADKNHYWLVYLESDESVILGNPDWLQWKKKWVKKDILYFPTLDQENEKKIRDRVKKKYNEIRYHYNLEKVKPLPEPVSFYDLFGGEFLADYVKTFSIILAAICVLISYIYFML